MYSAIDYLLASWVMGAVLIFLAMEFYGLLRAFAKLKGKIMGEPSGSAYVAARGVVEHGLTEHEYAGTRNAKQRIQ
jgi:hypothetical protein